MSAALNWRDEPINRHDTVTIRIIWVAVFLSLLVHIAALWTAPPLMRPLAFEPSDKPENSPALIAQLAPRASPPDSASPPPTPSPPSRAAPPPSRTAPRPTPVPVPVRPTPPPIARSETVPGAGPAPPPRPAQPAEAQPPRPPAEMDLSAYVAARRNARGEPAAPTPDSNAPPAETEKERLNRKVAANLGLNTTPTFGTDPKRGGGVFEIRRVGYDDAEFFFNGWDQDIGRIARQLIEVRKGTNPDIRIAVVRKIIEIIRAHVTDDFIFLSSRTNRQVALSARPSENAALEEFMMREFFSVERRQQ